MENIVKNIKRDLGVRNYVDSYLKVIVGVCLALVFGTPANAAQAVQPPHAELMHIKTCKKYLPNHRRTLLCVGTAGAGLLLRNGVKVTKEAIYILLVDLGLKELADFLFPSEQKKSPNRQGGGP